jgi:hypothetical protein
MTPIPKLLLKFSFETTTTTTTASTTITTTTLIENEVLHFPDSAGYERQPVDTREWHDDGRGLNFSNHTVPIT